MKKKIGDYIFLFLISGSIILLDQLTKYWIRQTLALGEVYRPDFWLSQYARLIFWKNTGAAFGMFQNFGDIFSIFSVVISVFVIYYFRQIPVEDWLIRLSMSMLLGGAVGNLVSRLTQGYVTDFISIGNFPVFNIADASISVGVVVLFFGMWIQEKRIKENPVEKLAELSSNGQVGPSASVSEDNPGE